MENRKEKSSKFVPAFAYPSILLSFRTIAVIGAGLMGAGIAHVSIDKGYNVILRDTTTKALSRGYSQITKGYQGYVKRKRFTK
jgi:enoyl-CoA hydratase/long-chain 3-hydroxyacyl-CoA dehydrogenase